MSLSDHETEVITAAADRLEVLATGVSGNRAHVLRTLASDLSGLLTATTPAGDPPVAPQSAPTAMPSTPPPDQPPS